MRAKLGDLDPRYESAMTDGSGVTFTFAFPRATYAIDAPDDGVWPHDLRTSFIDLLRLFERAR